MGLPGDVDQECVYLCSTINKIEGLRTRQSCCGHGKKPVRIWFEVDDAANLPILLYHTVFCHVGFNWDCTVGTDCGMAPVVYELTSRTTGDWAYKEANWIAEAIDIYLAGHASDLSLAKPLPVIGTDGIQRWKLADEPYIADSASGA